MSNNFLSPFLGALQASVAVLLTIFYGAIAGHYHLLSPSAAKDISKTCVKIFLPALLIHNVGSQLHADTGMKYVPILVWSITYNVISILMGVTATRVFKLPPWVSPAIAFNNTTSLPLLLVQSLATTGILSSLLPSGTDTSDAVAQAKSYFLVNSIVSNTLTFALGPRLLNGEDEDAPDNLDKKDNDDGDDEQNDVENGAGHEEEDEHTSLLPDRLQEHRDAHMRKVKKHANRFWDKMPPTAQSALHFLYQFLNAPVIGAVIGAIIGLTPALHRAFFNDTQEGGIFKAWLTSSINNIGSLFASLQVIVVGVKLSKSVEKQKEGEDSGSVPWKPFVFISLVRYALWPLISIPLIWALATKTNALPNDPLLWFTMMLMPAGPPAMKLTALADVNGSPEEEKMSIAKFLTVSYIISPLICFAVVASLKASEAALNA